MEIDTEDYLGTCWDCDDPLQDGDWEHCRDCGDRLCQSCIYGDVMCQACFTKNNS